MRLIVDEEEQMKQQYKIVTKVKNSFSIRLESRAQALDTASQSKVPYPPNLLMHALLFCIPCRTIRVQLPCAKILIKKLEIGIPL